MICDIYELEINGQKMLVICEGDRGLHMTAFRAGFEMSPQETAKRLNQAYFIMSDKVLAKFNLKRRKA